MSNTNGTLDDVLQPTTRGKIYTTKDALLLIQKCVSGELNAIVRRPHDRERAELVTAGNIFIYNERDSSIKRWTDGVNWSPSRIYNNFLVYRELDKGFTPGEKKKASRRSKRYSPYERTSPQQSSSESEEIFVAGASRKLTKEEERMLVGSLNDSYHFKQDGLIKKTFSVTFNDTIYHVVWYFSYYSYLEDNLQTPEQKYPNDRIWADFLGESQNYRVQLNAEGVEMSGSARERANRESNSQTPPHVQQTVYNQSQSIGRYSTTAFSGYGFNHQPQLQQMNLYQQRVPESHYSAPVYQENTHNAYVQQSRGYSVAAPQYGNHSNPTYTDSMNSQGQVQNIASPHRYQPNEFYYTHATQQPVDNVASGQQNRPRSSPYLNNGVQQFSHPTSVAEYQQYTVSSEPHTVTAGYVTSSNRDERHTNSVNASTQNHGQQPQGHVSPNQINGGYPHSYFPQE